MDRIAAHLGLDRTAVRAANFIQPDEFPYDQGLTFQDGRPLIYDSGDYPESLRMLKELIGWDAFPAEKERAAAEGGASASASAATSRAPASGRTRAATSRSPPTAGCTSPPVSPRRARGTRPSSRRSPRPSWACRWNGSRSSPATPAGSATRSAPSPRAPR
nr:hypothetical protein GCM10020093_039900 [Planobispora longispora]